MASRWPPLLATLLTLAHLALALGVSVTMPLFEEYDEASHVLFVRYLQVYHALPVQTTDTETARAHHPPLYYLLGAVLTSGIPVTGATDHIQLEPNPYFRIDPGEREADNKLRYVHYGPDERWPYRDLPLLAHWLRALTAVFSAVGVLFTYLAARQLRPHDAVFALGATALVAFHPEMVFNAGLVYNDSPVFASAALTIYLFLRFDRVGWTPKRWAILGTAFALGILLKLSQLTLAPAVALGALAWALRERKLRVWLVNGAAFLAPILLLTGWWFLRNYQLYGDWTGNAVIIQMWGTPPARSLWHYVEQLWGDPLGRFGTGEWVSFPGWAYPVASWVALLLGLVTLGLGARWAQKTGGFWAFSAKLQADSAARGWLFLGVSVGVGFVALFNYGIGVVGFVQTRYLFPVATALALLLMAGALDLWRRWPRVRGTVALGSGVALAYAALYAILSLILPVFGPPTTPSETRLAQSQKLDAQIGDVAQILGYDVWTGASAPDIVVTVMVYWRPLRQTPVPYSVFIHLVAPSLGGSIAQRDTYPGRGNWATTIWDIDRPFTDYYRLRFSPELLPLTDGELILGLYDRLTMERLPVSGGDTDSAQRWVRLGAITVP